MYKDDRWFKNDSWWENHRGAIIFWVGLTSIVTLGVIPWMIGCARIVSWLLT